MLIVFAADSDTSSASPEAQAKAVPLVAGILFVDTRAGPLVAAAFLVDKILLVA